MALTVGVWFWGSKFGTEYVDRLREGVKRHLSLPHRFVVFTPPYDDMPLTRIPGCLCRLRMFDPEWQRAQRIDDQVVCMDLDSVVTGSLDEMFSRQEPFVILQGANTANPCLYNGSLWMLRAGYRPDVWHDLSLNAVAQVPFHEFPDDQGWMAHKIPGAAGWQSGEQSGVVAFKKPGWPKGDTLPDWAKLVVFPGWRDPSKFTHLPWVKEHWK